MTFPSRNGIKKKGGGNRKGGYWLALWKLVVIGGRGSGTPWNSNLGDGTHLGSQFWNQFG